MDSNNWQTTRPEIFWGEMAPCEHVVQIYETDLIFLDSLEGFVTGGLKMGDCVIIIATKEHLNALEERLEKSGFDMIEVRAKNQYISLDAEETLDRFMVDEWPDEKLFKKLVIELLDHGNGRKIRAFGEMVALLWAKGYNGATVRLEHLWTLFCHSGAFSLFCAYPRSGFTQDPNTSVKNICIEHSKVIDGLASPVNEILFRETNYTSS